MMGCDCVIESGTHFRAKYVCNIILKTLFYLVNKNQIIRNYQHNCLKILTSVYFPLDKMILVKKAIEMTVKRYILVLFCKILLFSIG